MLTIAQATATHKVNVLAIVMHFFYMNQDDPAARQAGVAGMLVPNQLRSVSGSDPRGS